MTHYVYVIRAGKDQFKIGHSKQPLKRKQQLQTGNAFHLSFFRLYEFPATAGAVQAETVIKDYLHRYRTKGGGSEFFLITESFMKPLLYDIFTRTNVLYEWDAQEISPGHLQ